MMIAAIIVFAIVYLLIATERVNRVVAALAGAGVILAIGVVGPDDAFFSKVTGIDWNVIFLLFGMMVIVGVLRQTGVFEYVAIWAAKKAKGRPFRVMTLLCLLTAVASAGLDNVTTVLLIAPVTLLVCERIGVRPVPFLIAEALASNIGGTSTLVGDPPNLIVASRSGLGFNDFLLNMAPIVVVMLVVFVALSRFLFRKDFTADPEQVAQVMELDEREAIQDRPLLIRSLVVLAMVLVGLAWWVASPFTIRHARLVQRTGRFMVGWIKGLSEWWEPNAQLTEKDISPHFWPNGTMPSSAEFEALVADEFARYRLRVGGLVEVPREFSFADLKALPKQEQITTHFCIQGWSGVAKWGGVSMRDILDIVRPTPDARYAVFYSFSEGSAGGGYYDVHELRNMQHRLTILAYEMNGAPVSVLHGAPLRLRCENELGFKMVKWIAAIEFVRDFAHLGAGQGGYNDDHEFYGYRMPI